MRRFHSYGPVDLDIHFGVERKRLVDTCVNQLVGQLDKGGHYFTIWAARQTGKTWLMRQAMTEIPKRYGERFTVLNFSLGRLRGMPFHSPIESAETFMPKEFSRLLQQVLPGKPTVDHWDDFMDFFSRESPFLDRPCIMLIDEIDTIPSVLLDLMVGRFRELYLYRETNWLHGLALTGVRAVAGIESQRGSPFNIQRSLHVPNLTSDEVREMYQQYQAESGQAIDPAVVEKVYDVTRGQPGLVSWFGELLTEPYNPGPSQPITIDTWHRVWNAARFLEPNNTVMNLIAKARMEEYQPFLVKLFTHANIPFLFHDPLHNYLFMHGIIQPEVIQESPERYINICRFTSPFVQDCLYTALSKELTNDPDAVYKLDPLDELTDVFDGVILNLPALLERYKAYLLRLKTSGYNPWKDQPRRATDFQLTEAVGHFHLFGWIQEVLRRQCVVSPEFPTGNGKVDVHIRWGEQRAIIEVKSFANALELKEARKQAARYGKQLGLDSVTLAVFISVADERVLTTLSTTEVIDGVSISTVMISWV